MPASHHCISFGLLQLFLLLLLVRVVIGQSFFAPLSPAAYRQLLQSARNGNVSAQADLGVRLQYGRGVTRNLVEAEYWLRIAAGRGSPDAQLQLGLLYVQPGMVSDHGADALRWFMQAASSGLSAAEYDIALMYLRGLGIPVNFAEADRWLRKADRHGAKRAKSTLGVLLLGSPEPERKREGFELLRKSAKEGDADGRNALAYCYEFAIGTASDLKAAVRLYQEAAKAGNLDAMHSLGMLYWSGKGVPRDLGEAFNWKKRGCDGGNAASCWSLGAMYLIGEGVPKNLALAYAYIGVGGANPKILADLAPLLSDEERSKASAEIEKWETFHAIELSALPLYINRTRTKSNFATTAGK